VRPDYVIADCMYAYRVVGTPPRNPGDPGEAAAHH
jgi:hypothetical protein